MGCHAGSRGPVFFLSFRIASMSVSAARTTFWSMPVWWVCRCRRSSWSYTGASIVQTFFVTAASFGALSLYGYTTRRDLSAMGSFMIMGLFGIIIASLVNIFLQSSAMAFAISILGVVIFAGLTAY